MNPYITLFKQQLSQYESACGITEPGSILDFLFYWYSAMAPVDDGRILKSEQALSPVFESLSVEDSDTLFDRISDLCLAYQRAAFLEGLRLGYHLSEELQNTEHSL